jgi:DNA-binding protein HU-beta
MDKDELIREISDRTGYTLQDTRNFFEALVNIFSESIEQKQEIDVRGFGHLRIKKVAGGLHRFSKTKEAKMYPASMRVFFSLSKNLRALVKTNK